MLTRSGSNRHQGTVYQFFRDDALNANEFFRNRAGQPKPVLKQNQFGGTLRQSDRAGQGVLFRLVSGHAAG